MSAPKPTAPECIAEATREWMHLLSSRVDPWDYVNELTEKAAQAVWEALLAEGRISAWVGTACPEQDIYFVLPLVVPLERDAP